MHPQFFVIRPLVLLAVLVIISPGCISARRNPNLQQIFSTARQTPGKRPIIVIPGILGSELINNKTKQTVWPTPFRTSQEGLPMNPNLSLNTDDLVPGRIVETVKLARILPEVYVYRDLLDALRRYVGYRDGDWNKPDVGGDMDTFYVFAYDWRKDNVANARELITRIRRLKEKLGRPDLRFNVVAHSMGGLIARYAAMYGDADLPSNEDPIQPNWAGAAHINKIVMIGVPNEGSADAFATLIEGYSITEGLRRRVPLLNKLTAEDAVSTPAVFQLLPHRDSVRFLDENLKPLKIDLYDAAIWKHYGWSPINDPEFRRRHSHSNDEPRGDGLANDSNELDAYFEATLRRTRKFHEALDASSAIDAPVTLLAIGGDCEETLNSPVIVRDAKRNRWLTLIRPREYTSSTGVKYSKRQVTEAMYAPGDGRVTRSSLLGQSSNTNGIALAYAVFGCDLHGQLQRNKTLQDNALSAIVGEIVR